MEDWKLKMLIDALKDSGFQKNTIQGLVDTVNRGVIGGLLGAPVDLTAMLMKPFGYSNPSPFMGSEWIGNKMQQAGMVSANRNPIAETLSGFVDPVTAGASALKTAGLLATTAAQKGPQLARLISSQKYLDEARVAEKMKNGDFTVKVSPPFSVDGETLQAIQDGHHALEAANRSGVSPKFITQTATENDRIGLLNQGKVEDYLNASYQDSPWYYMDNGREIW